VHRASNANKQINLVRNAVVASFAARHAIIKAVLTQANISQALAAAAILFAGALVLGRVISKL
jgi:hypothetical protein